MMGRLVHPGIPDVADVGRVAWSPTGDQLVTQYRGSIALWNPKEVRNSIVCVMAMLIKRYENRTSITRSMLFVSGMSSPLYGCRRDLAFCR
jgi:hypothetical protein